MEVTSTFSSVPQVDTEVGKFVDNTADADKLRLDFLKLLTAQLQYQDPLEPVENTEFTSQMAQFTGLGEQQRSNELLEKLLNVQSVSQMNQAVSYIGKQVIVSGDQTTAKEGEALVRFDMPESGVAAINLYDSSGQLVKTLSAQAFEAGEQRKIIRDPELLDGSYRFSVQVGVGDEQVAAATQQSGLVTGVVNGDSGVTLDLDGRRVSLSDVLRVEQTNS